MALQGLTFRIRFMMELGMRARAESANAADGWDPRSGHRSTQYNCADQ
jgi:hypothetical protein